MLVRADPSSAGRCLGHNDKQRARAETRGRSRELIAGGGRYERQIVLALANDRMFLAAATVGCRPSACASTTIPKQVGHNSLGFGRRQRARCRPAGDCRSAEPELGPTSPGSQSSRCRRQHRFANCSRTLRPTDTRFICRSCPPSCRCQVPRPICQSSCRVTLPRSGSRAENPMFIVVTPSLRIKNLPDLIARAKGRPDEISCAVTGIGRLTHLTAGLLQDRAGIKLLIVPYTGGPAHAISDVVSGRVGVIIEGYSGIAGAVQSGSVKAIAVASEKRLAEFPDLPTVAETIPGFSATGWQVLVAPVGTPEKIIRKVSEDLRKVVTDPDLKK